MEKLTKEQFKQRFGGTKVAVINAENSANIQRKVIACGGGFVHVDDRTVIRYEDEPYLYIDDELRLSYGKSPYTFEDSDKKIIAPNDITDIEIAD